MEQLVIYQSDLNRTPGRETSSPKQHAMANNIAIGINEFRPETRPVFRGSVKCRTDSKTGHRRQRLHVFVCSKTAWQYRAAHGASSHPDQVNLHVISFRLPGSGSATAWEGSLGDLWLIRSSYRFGDATQVAMHAMLE
jgi:hypothetical protein